MSRYLPATSSQTPASATVAQPDTSGRQIIAGCPVVGLGLPPTPPYEGAYWNVAAAVTGRMLEATPIGWTVESMILRKLSDISCSLGSTFALLRAAEAMPLGLFLEPTLLRSEGEVGSLEEITSATVHDRRLMSVATAAGPDRFVTIEADFED